MSEAGNGPSEADVPAPVRYPPPVTWERFACAMRWTAIGACVALMLFCLFSQLLFRLIRVEN
jgi:hypothetical protein